LAGRERLLRFDLPEVTEVKAYFVRDPETGEITARTEEELEEIEEKGEKEKGEEKEGR